MNGYATRLKFISKTAVVLFAALMMTSCATTTQVVLLPDKEDKVSVLEVTDTEGKKNPKTRSSMAVGKNIAAYRRAGRAESYG